MGIFEAVAIAYDGSLMGSLNVMPLYKNHCELTTAMTAVNTCATFLGAILVGPFTPAYTDKYSRRVGIHTACIIHIIGAILAGAAQNIGMLIAGCMIIGVGVVFAQTSAGTYVAETTPPKIRSFALGLYFSC